MESFLADVLTLNAMMALFTLAALEIVLGIDNVVFIAILSGKLPAEEQAKARNTGLALAAAGRIILLFFITWIITLDQTVLFQIGSDPEPVHAIAVGEPHPQAPSEDLPDHGSQGAHHRGAQDHGVHNDGAHAAWPIKISVKDLILILGGLFLLAKATWEVHETLEGHGHSEVNHDAPDQPAKRSVHASFNAVIAQILMLDMVFSIDSVLTAVGMVKPETYSNPWAPLFVMSTGVILAIVVMLSFAGPLARFVQRRPTIKMLALSFLLLIGFVLVAEGFHQHIPRGYIYFAMAFSLMVELLNLKFVKKRPLPPASGSPPESEGTTPPTSAPSSSPTPRG